MKSLFDEYGNLDLEQMIENQPSFQTIVEDGIITREELSQQSDRVAASIKEFEASATAEQIDLLGRILAEVSVLVAIRGLVRE